MPLRKSPMPPARLEANRRSARKSTGPRTALGKSQSRLNGLRSGSRSCLLRDLMQALFDALPGAVAPTARAVLTPAQLRHPLFAELVGIMWQPERQLMAEIRDGSWMPDFFLYDRRWTATPSERSVQSSLGSNRQGGGESNFPPVLRRHRALVVPYGSRHIQEFGLCWYTFPCGQL
jgi:hypothetical protein